jgi:hypothetical protein
MSRLTRCAGRCRCSAGESSVRDVSASPNARASSAQPYRLVLVARYRPDADKLLPGILDQIESSAVSRLDTEIIVGYLEDDRKFHVLASVGPNL